MTRNLRLAVPTLVLVVLVAACGDDDSAGTTGGSSPAADATSPAPMPPGGTESVDAGPLYLGVSIHVEGWKEEAENEAMFNIHRAGLLEMAETAAASGAVFTFEFSEVFMDAVLVWDSDIIDQLTALGHGTGIHADVGGRGDPSLDELVTELSRMRDKAASLGVDTRHVSGICSRGPWVEAAIEVGFQSTNGAVEYCATSLDPDVVPDSWDLSGCTNPAACHGQLQVDDQARIHPYPVSSSADFLTPAADGLVLMIGNSGEAVDCAAEQRTGGGGCVGEPDDLPYAADVLAEFLAQRDPSRLASLSMSWSVGSIPTADFVAAFVDVFADAVTAGDAEWSANADTAQLVIGEVSVVSGVADALPVVVSIHAHFTRDHEPYTTPMLEALDQQEFDQLLELVDETAEVLAENDVVANWQMSYGVARALCSEDVTGTVDELVGLGHEIGVHVHALDDLDDAVAAVAICGITPTTVSGLNFTTGRASAGGAVDAAITWLQTVEDAGFTTVLVGLGDGSNPLDRNCGQYAGAPFVAQAGALLHSWRADPTDPCSADPAGTLEIVTHAGLPDRSRPGAAGASPPTGPLQLEDAAVWAEWLDLAVELSDPGSTWGIVMPFGAMSDRFGAHEEFLLALESILHSITEWVDAGRAVSVTGSQAFDAAR